MAQIRSLSDLKGTIADDLARSDLTTAIEDAIEDAIQHYQSEGFWFSWSRSVTFSTVNARTTYTASDVAEMPSFIHLESVFITRSGNQVFPMEPISVGEWEQLSDASAVTGEPFWYAWQNETLYLYPTPNAAYTIRLHGHQGIHYNAAGTAYTGIGAPDDDAEINVYMRHAFELIRAHAKQLLYAHKLHDEGAAMRMQPLIERALSALRREAQSRAGGCEIISTQF